MDSRVDEFIAGESHWGAEFALLREIALSCQLTETLKWGVPCYTHRGSNIILIHGFKQYCAILFVNGALLEDPEGLLIRQTERVQAGRQMRFENPGQISERADAIRKFIHRAIELESAGVKVQFKDTEAFAIPPEFEKRLKEDKALERAFRALTPGRQRAYLIYFGEPKQQKTRELRIEKCVDPILAGKGLNDR